MKLSELDPRFLQVISNNTFRSKDVPLAEADGICFLCPKCFAANGNSNVGTHAIICWRPKVPPEIQPGPGRWEFEGTGFDDLTLKASSSSIALQGGCAAHFFVTNGEIISA